MSNEEAKYITSLIEERKEEELKSLVEQLYPADIAELLEELPAEETLFFYRLLPGTVAADVLMEMDEVERKEVLDLLTDEEIADTFLTHMDSDDAADLLQELDEDKQDAILAHVEDIEQAGEIIDLLKYGEDTAGGIMRKEMMVVNENWSMPRCMEELRIQAAEMEDVYYIYVIDDEERLQGILPIKKVLTSPNVSKIKHVILRDPIVVHENDTAEEVVRTFERYDLVAIPVVDSIGRLVGVITVDDVVDQMRELHEKDYQLASGLSSDIESSDTVVRQIGARLPWLLLGMVGGMLNSVILGGYDNVFAAVPAISLFIPLMGGTGGNVGMQSSAIIVQDLATGSIKPGKVGSLLLKELAIALMNGGILSLVLFIYNYFYLKDIVVMSSVSISIFTVVLFASLSGTIVPLTLERLKMDPARATGPFITIMNDLIGMFIYMNVTNFLFNYFN
ncbi:Magnesium transporter MgtE [Porphyromonas levii]|nr:Magnesium transporter MgtE [Porphyromonas levii]MBR8715138.1 Magnesium transporter MgtE [Porphyromonas levii]MBR8727589.1 Magnesium transporter MgtE [Porphyromonas levii]MBR8735999.1 Magnesium transporter MgtE [Porphyromonas levii]MBR8765117.1 Magnesium transporter MgtE [Porphyromonas levii]